ncbi:MAG: hypothetical protein HWQ41_29810 [Nostoc sp. NOS(2021)]|nr:hypothetical protein [Nostoc sp. NOS(2021)]
MEQVEVECCQCDACGGRVRHRTSYICHCPSYQRSDRLFYSEGDDIVVRFITNQNTSV